MHQPLLVHTIPTHSFEWVFFIRGNIPFTTPGDTMFNSIMTVQLTNSKESLDSLGYRWAEGLSLDDVYREVHGGLPVVAYDHDLRKERERADISFLLTLGVDPKDHGYPWWGTVYTPEDTELEFWSSNSWVRDDNPDLF